MMNKIKSAAFFVMLLAGFMGFGVWIGVGIVIGIRWAL